MKTAGRPRGRNPNHHLFLRSGIWIFRWVRDGRDQERSTGCPKSEIARARTIRDKWIGIREAKRHGVEEIPAAGTIGAVVTAYLEAESKPYDREKGGDQPGAKRSAADDRVYEKRLRDNGLDFSLSADLLDAEHLLDVAKSMSKLAPLTRRNTFRFLRRVFAWARSNKRKTGVRVNPFADLEEQDEKRLFSNKVKAQAPPFERDQLRALYERLPAHAMRPVRFAAHTGMRWHSEILRMVWGRVDLARRVYVTDPRWTKMREREVPLGAVAVEILEAIRPAKPAADDPVWLNAEGKPLRDVRTVFEDRVHEVCPEPRSGYRYPDFHSLRRTCATALAQVAPGYVVAAVLGHAKSTVTDRYVTVPLDAMIDAADRAALLIDGAPEKNVLPMKRKMGDKMGVRVGSGR